MRSKGRVVTAAVLRMENERHIEKLRFQMRILAVGTQHIKDIFRCRQLGLRRMDNQAFVLVIIAVRLKAVDRQYREQGNQLQALAQHVRNGGILRILVIGIKRQHASCHRVHDILTRRFHNNIAHKACRQRAVIVEQGSKFLELLLLRQLAEQEQVCNLFKAEAVVLDKTGDNLFHVVAPVKKLAVYRHALAVDNFRRAYLRYFRQTRQDALPV